MDNDDTITIDLGKMFNLLISKIGWIILTMALFGICGYILNWYVAKPKYQADAMIVVNTREDQNVVVTNDQMNSARQLVNTYEVILKSDTVIDQVISGLNNRGLAQNRQFSTGAVKDQITVSPVNNTPVMKISAVDEDPEIALAMVDELLTVSPSIIIRTVKAGSVEVVSFPKLNPNPVSPKKTRNLALFLFGGAFAAAAVIIYREVMDNTIKSDEDIKEKLDLTVLGVIPKIRESDLVPKSSRKSSRNGKTKGDENEANK